MTHKSKGTITGKFLSGGLKLGSGQAAIQASSFIRNVILARLISTADFGIASIFAMAFYLLEMISNLAAETLLVQAEDGDDPPFQATAQLLQAGRGLLNATVIFLLATPISRLFGVPRARWAFACLALLPLIKGFTNLDPSRMQRHMRYEPEILMNLIPSVIVTVLAYPLAAWLRDYSAMLWLLVAQMAITVLVSHLVAERRYTWAWEPHYSKRIFTFGLPLLINGILMYLIFQGDRVVIGAAHQLFSRSNFTLSDLGVYSVAFALTLAPSLLASNVGSALFLPVLSRAQTDREQFIRRYIVCAQVLTLAAAMITIPFVVAGGPLVVFVYGEKYAAAIQFVGWLGAMQFLRTMRVVPTIAAMSLGDTRNSMYSNLARTTAFLGILIVAAMGWSLSSVAACGFFGEVLALAVCLGRLQREHSVRTGVFFRAAAVPTAGLAISAVIAYLGVQQMQWPIAMSTAVCVMAIVFSATIGVFPDLRKKLWTAVFPSERRNMNADSISTNANPKVCMLGASFSTDNFGVNVLTVGTIEALLHAYPRADLSIMDYAREPITWDLNLRGRHTRIPLVNIRFSKKPWQANHIAFLIIVALFSQLIPSANLRRKLLARNRVLRHLQEADFITAISGGDSFSDIYGMQRLFYTSLPQLLILLLGKRLILLPQTIGPFRSHVAKLIARYVFRHAEVVYSRDLKGIEDVKTLLGTNFTATKVLFSYDVGFVVEPELPRESDIAERINLLRTRGPLIGLNVSGLLFRGGYTGKNMFGLKAKYNELMYALIELLASQENGTILLAPHVFSGAGAESDYAVCDRLFKELRPHYGERLHLLQEGLNEREVKYVIGQCDFFLGARMHACIAALSQAVPTVPIAYSDKFIGVMQTLGVEHLVADPRHSSEGEILRHVRDCYDHRDEIREKLKRTMPAVRNRALTLFTDPKTSINTLVTES